MESIQQTLQELYEKNRVFFKKNYEELFNTLIDFESNYTETFYIEIKNNHFELSHIDGTNFYNCDPFFDATHRSSNINKDVSGIFTLDLKSRDVKSSESFDHNKFINEYINLNDKKEISSGSYKKFIFVGTLLGVHLNDIDKVTNNEASLIIEDNIEIFRLSMFLTDYEQLSFNKKLFFAVNVDFKTLEKMTKEFLDYKNEYNYFIKFEIASERYVDTFNTISNIISSLNPLIYPFSEPIKSFKNGINNFYLYNKLLNLSVLYNFLHSRKVLFLASGPSLFNNIHYIKENKEKFIIVSVVSALKRLEKEDIVADILITIDSNEYVIDDIDVDQKYYQDSIILASINTDKNVMNKLQNSTTYLIQNSMELFKEYGIFTGVTVGDVGVKLLLQLGVKELYLCGIDAALDQETGDTHDSTHISSNTKKLEVSTILDNENTDFSEVVIKVKGNFHEEVYSTKLFEMIIKSFATIKHNSNIFNTSNGAYLEGTTPKKFEQISLCDFPQINKMKFNKEFTEDLETIQKVSFSEIDLKLFKQELDSINQIKKNQQAIKGTFVAHIMDQYEKIIFPYSQYLLDNNISNKKILNEIRIQQIALIIKELTDVLSRIKY